MKRNLFIGVLAIILFLMWGWSCPSFAEKILRLGVKSGDMGMLDPKLSATTANIPIMDTLYNGLVRFRPGSVSFDSIEPDLAERWTHSPDKKIWTFYLRKGVQFHKGFGELTAEDVVWNLEKSRKNETSIFANRYTAYSKVEALDRYTVQITLSLLFPRQPWVNKHFLSAILSMQYFHRVLCQYLLQIIYLQGSTASRCN